MELQEGQAQNGLLHTCARNPLDGCEHVNEIGLALLFLLVNYHSICSLQFDNLNAAHETTKLEIEASHSEKVELLKKTYETSLSGKGAFCHFSGDVTEVRHSH